MVHGNETVLIISPVHQSKQPTEPPPPLHLLSGADVELTETGL